MGLALKRVMMAMLSIRTHALICAGLQFAVTVSFRTMSKNAMMVIPLMAIDVRIGAETLFVAMVSFLPGNSAMMQMTSIQMCAQTDVGMPSVVMDFYSPVKFVMTAMSLAPMNVQVGALVPPVAMALSGLV
jgi:hypothetical protein